MASCRCRGTIRCFLLSRAAFPASSRISAARYSRTAARYTLSQLAVSSKASGALVLTRCAASYALSVVSFLQQTVYTTDRELKAGLGGTRLGLGDLTGSLTTRFCFAAFSGHCRCGIGKTSEGEELSASRRGDGYAGIGNV